MEEEFSVNHIINLMKRVKKTDILFKPLKKLKTAIESVGLQAVSLVPTSRIIVFHFGLGNQLDRQFIDLTKPIGLLKDYAIIPGHSYCILQFIGVDESISFMKGKQQIEGKQLYFTQIQYQNLSRIIVFMFCQKEYFKEQQQISLPSCLSTFEQNIDGLFLINNIISQQQQIDLLAEIDQRPWEKLNNRRVQHYGYDFKYGANQIDKNQHQTQFPAFLHYIIQKLKQIELLKHVNFDQLTINDYFAGNGIPAHFDTHSPFEQYFVSLSLLSPIVMDFRKYDGREQQVYLKERSVVIFSGQVRYAWTHGIACRKIDKIDGTIQSRSRRLSLTFREIKYTPCKCPYYFYCDSQGYQQETMKKNNPLLTKFMSKLYAQQLKQYSHNEIEKQYVEKAYNGFGFDFHNKVISEVKSFFVEIQPSDFILDAGCGNGQYAKHIHTDAYYFPIQKCVTMQPIFSEIYMDCLKLCFVSASFDHVLFIAVLHHFASVQNRIKALRQINRVLKIGGMLYLTVMSYEQKEDIYNCQETILEYCLPINKLSQKQILVQCDHQQPRIESRGQVYKRYYHLFTLIEITQLLEKTNFKVVKKLLTKENIIISAKKQQ